MGKKSSWGSPRKLPSGRWQARYTDDAGRLISAPDTFSTKADALAWLAAKRTDLARGMDVDDTANRRPLKHWWPILQADAQRRLKPSTVKYYDESWNNHVRPRFGSTAVGRIRPSHVDQWIGDMIDAGVSKSRVKGAVGVLNRLIERAVRDRAIMTNPVSLRSENIGSSPSVNRPVLQPSEIAALHDAAHVPADDEADAGGSQGLACLVSVLAAGGLRIGEALGLQRQDVDVAAGTLHVQRSLSEINGVVHITAPKNGKGRTVTLPDSVVAELRQYLKDVAIHQDAWLWPNTIGKPQKYSNFRRRQWLPMVDRMNEARAEQNLDLIDVMPHDLRGTCASLLIDAGASPKDVQHHLGHAEISTTMNLYARVRPGRADDLAERMNAVLTGVGQ